MSERGTAYEWLIGWRQMRAKRRNHFISFISLLSMLGISLGVAALIVVLAVIDGLQGELRNRILGVAAHVQVTGPGEVLGDWQRAAEKLRSEPGVVGAAPYVEGQALLSFAGGARGAQLRGIDPMLEPQVSDVGKRMIVGELSGLRPGEFGIALGVELARALGIHAGDRVEVISPEGIVTPAGIIPRTKLFRVVGLFSAGMPEFDAGLALVSLEDAQKFYRLGDRVSGVRLALKDIFQAPQVTARLNSLQSSGWKATDWTRTHAAFFRALQIEKTATFIMLSLIVAVAAFNVVSMLVMAVNEKRSDIAILRTIGAAPRSIQLIFMIQGAMLGLFGTFVGDILGIIVALKLDVIVPAIEEMLGVHFFPADVYYVTTLPAELKADDVTIITLLSLVLCLLATIYPSRRAARTRPVEALRYA